MSTVSPNPGVSEPPSNSVTTQDGVGGTGVSEIGQVGEFGGALLSELDSVAALSYSSSNDTTAVANGATVDAFSGYCRTDSVSPGIGTVTELAFEFPYLLAASATDFYFKNRDIEVKYSWAGIVDMYVGTTETDTNPLWPEEVTASYQSESRPSGVFAGYFANLTDAITGGAVVGDWYGRLGTIEFFEITSIGPDTETEIFRAGADNFPSAHAVIAQADRVVIFDLATGQPEMWMVFQTAFGYMLDGAVASQSVAYSDGILYVGKSGVGLQQINFADDRANGPHYRFRAPGPFATKGSYTADIAARNTANSWNQETGRDIVNDTVNDVAAKVLDSVSVTNLLSASEDLTNAYWIKIRSFADSSSVLREDNSPATSHYFRRPLSSAEIETFTLRVVPAERQYMWIGANQGDINSGCIFDAANGVVTFVGPNVKNCSILPSNLGGYLCSVTVDSPFAFDAAISSDGSTIIYDGDGVSTIRIFDIQSEPSTSPHEYVPSVTGPTTADRPPAKQLINEDIGGGVLRTIDTGLFVPIWHVETATDVSVGLDNGNIPDITGMIGTNFGGWIGQEIFFTDTFLQIVYRGPVPTADIGVGTWATASYTANPGFPPYFLPTTVAAADAGNALYIGTDGGLTVIDDPAFALVTTDENTGYMVDPDGAWANDNSTATIGFPFDLYEDFEAPDIRLLTDDFSRTDIAPWTDESSAGGVVEIVAGELVVDSTGGTARARSPEQVSTVGDWYSATFEVTQAVGTTDLFLIDSTLGVLATRSITAPGTYKLTAQATNGGILAQINSSGGAISATNTVALDEVPALEGWDEDDADLTVNDGKLTVTISTPGIGKAIKGFASVAARNDIAQAEYVGGSVSGVLAIGSTPGGTDIAVSPPQASAGTITLPFVGTGATVYLSLRCNTTTVGEFTEWNLATSQQDPTGNNSLPDNSGQGNDGTAIGELTRDPFSDIFGIGTSNANGFDATVTPGGQLIGWERIKPNGQWRFRRDTGDWIDAEESGGIVSLRGDRNTGSSAVMVRWNATPMTESQLDATERIEQCIANANYVSGSGFSAGFDEGFG